MSVAGDIIDDLKFAPAETARALTGAISVFAVSIFLMIGVFSAPGGASETYIQASAGSVQKASGEFSGGAY